MSLAFHDHAFALDLASLLIVWRLLTISGAAFSMGLSFLIATRVFRNGVWGRISLAFVGLMLMGALEQVGRLDDHGHTWRLPAMTAVLVCAISAQVAILRRRVNPYERPRG